MCFQIILLFSSITETNYTCREFHAHKVFMYHHMAETNFYYSIQHDVIFAFWVTYQCISLMEEVSYVLCNSYKHFIFNPTFGSKTGTTNGGKACGRLQWCQRTKHAHAAANGPDHAAAHNATVHAASHAATHNAAVHTATYAAIHAAIHAAAHNATGYAVYP